MHCNVCNIFTGRPKRSPGGTDQRLSPSDEVQLVAYIKFMATAAQPVTAEWCRIMASRIAHVRGVSFKRQIPSRGWWSRFLKRHPDLSIRTPSVINGGRLAMSRRVIIDNFFSESRCVLEELCVFDDATRIYNIDETWTGNVDDQKRQKIVSTKTIRIPYQWQMTTNEHITLTMCICADGMFLPTMVTFAKSFPSDDEFLSQGPEHCLHTATDSGHIDSAQYLQYIKHIEPHMSSTRPVVIFQDNLAAHQSNALVEYCMSKNIHLINFPSKTTHILQPLDKLFGTLKHHLQARAREAALLNPKGVSRSKMPILLKFAMKAMATKVVQNSFKKTGLCPLDGTVICDEVLVGDDSTQCSATQPSSGDHILSASSVSSTVEYTSIQSPVLRMQVFQSDDEEIFVHQKSIQIGTQTSPVASLPCSTCLNNDVKLHPLISSQVVDLEFAEALFSTSKDTTSDKRVAPSQKRNERDYSKGKWLTSESEVIRREAETKQKALEKEQKDKEKAEKTAKREAKKYQDEERKKMNSEKKLKRGAESQARIGKMEEIKDLKLAAKRSVT